MRGKSEGAGDEESRACGDEDGQRSECNWLPPSDGTRLCTSHTHTRTRSSLLCFLSSPSPSTIINHSAYWASVISLELLVATAHAALLTLLPMAFK